MTKQKQDATCKVPKLRFPEFREAGEWEKDELRKVADFLNERMPLEQLTLANYVSTENILPDFEGLAKASKLPSSGSATRFKANDVLISNIRPYLKKVWFSNKDGGASNDVIVIRAKEGLREQYLSFMLKNDSFIEYVMKGAKGVKMPRGDISLMREYPLAYPSESEQQKIADCLSSIDELVTLEAQKLDTLKTHKKGLMQQLFPAEGETLPKRRFPEFRDAGEWEEKCIRDLGEIVTGSTPSTTKPEFYGGERFFVSPADISDQRFIEKTKTTLTELGFSETRPIKAGSILFVCIGSTIGKVAQNLYECATNQQINAVIPGSEYANAFVYYSLENNSEKISGLAGNHAVPIINKTAFGSVEVKFPRFPEQQKIADCLSSLDELITAQTQKLATLKAHKKGLMQQLFPELDEEQG